MKAPAKWCRSRADRLKATGGGGSTDAFGQPDASMGRPTFRRAGTVRAIRSCPDARLCLKLLVNEAPLNVTINHQGV